MENKKILTNKQNKNNPASNLKRGYVMVQINRRDFA
jgi:hypothetical protein